MSVFEKPKQYRHLVCGTVTTVPDGAAIAFASDPVYAAERYKDSPNFKAGTFCAGCGRHEPRVHDGAHRFEWLDKTPVTD